MRSVAEFGEWTTREVDIAIRKIQVRRHNDIAIQANMHGIDMKPMMAPSPETRMEPVDDMRVDAIMQAALTRKAEESANGQPK